MKSLMAAEFIKNYPNVVGLSTIPAENNRGFSRCTQSQVGVEK